MFAALNSFQVGGSTPTFVSDVFSTTLYSGNSSSQTITNGINLSTNGGLVWCKSRNSASNHWLFDTNRGVNKYLQSQNSDAEGTLTNSLPTFNSNGFDLGSNGPNSSGVSYVSWTFRQAPKFFDVVTWTGNGSASQTISHNLQSTPGCIIVKKTSAGGANWFVYHKYSENSSGTNGENGYLVLNTTGNLNYVGTDVWTPTSTTFQANETYNFLNSTGETYVAYLFANDAGGFGGFGTDNIVTCGYVGSNPSGEGSVNLGYEPQWILLKETQTSGTSWLIFDTQRGWFNDGVSSDKYLIPNLSDAEAGSVDYGGPNSTGFSIKNLTTSSSFIYITIKAT